VDDNRVGALLLQDRGQPQQGLGHDRLDALAGFEQLQVVLRDNPEDVVDLRQHLPVLTGDADAHPDGAAPAQPQHQRRGLDRLGPVP